MTTAVSASAASQRRGSEDGIPVRMRSAEATSSG